MAFPHIFTGSPDNNVRTDFTGTGSNTTSMLLSHYSSLSGRGMAPFSGAYSFEIALTGTSDVYLEDDTSAILADAGTTYYGFPFCLSKGATLADTERIDIFQAHSAAAVEADIAIYYTTAGGFVVGAVETASTALTGKTGSIVTGQWYFAEVKLHAHSDGSGTIDFYLNGYATGSQSASLTGAAITGVNYGLLNQATAGTGSLLLGTLVQDDARMYPPPARFARDIMIYKSGHAFVGPGYLDAAALLSGTGTSLTLYDSDEASTAQNGIKAELSYSYQTSISGPLKFERGCYCVLAGTNPYGQVILAHGEGLGGIKGPLYHSDWGYKYWGGKRNTAPTTGY